MNKHQQALNTTQVLTNKGMHWKYFSKLIYNTVEYNIEVPEDVTE